MADESIAANEAKDRHHADRAEENIERRRLRENTTLEADEGSSIDGETPGNAGGYYSSGGKEDEAEEKASPAAKDPSKGSFIDLTT